MTRRQLYDFLVEVSGPHRRVTAGVNSSRALHGKDLYGSYHFPRFYFPTAFRNTLLRFNRFRAPTRFEGWVVYEFGCCLGALGLECARRGARVRAWEYNDQKVLGCRRLAQWLRFSQRQVAFYQQDIRAWLGDPDTAQREFSSKFPPADLTICCALDAYIRAELRPELYRFLAQATKRLCWFESNCRAPIPQLEQQLHQAGFATVEFVAASGHRSAFVCRTAAPASSDSSGHSSHCAPIASAQLSSLRAYIDDFLSRPQHWKCFAQDREALLTSLIHRNRLSISLMPADQHISLCADSDTVNRWYYRYAKPYARWHKGFLNRMDQELRATLYHSKLLEHPRERNLRDFLEALSKARRGSASERSFFKGLDFTKPMEGQGVELIDCVDFSSGRAYDEGAIVNRITLARGKGRISFFLKGLGNVRKRKSAQRGPKGAAQFEVTALEAARMIGLNSAFARFYSDRADPRMAGYTLLEEIPGSNTNVLFEATARGFRIRPEFRQHRDRLVREFAAIAALSDLLRKGDRKIFQPLHPEYDANCLVDLDALANRPRRRAIYAIDYNHLFFEDNRSALHDLEYGHCSEWGIVAAFAEFHRDPVSRAQLVRGFEKAYLRQWSRILSRRKQLAMLIAKNHGRNSYEYRIFSESISADPRQELAAQREALLHTLPLKPARSAPAKIPTKTRAGKADTRPSVSTKMLSTVRRKISAWPAIVQTPAYMIPNTSILPIRTNTARFFTHDRLDLVVKYRLFAGLLRGCLSPEDEEMYARHILARTRGIEPGNPAKAGIALYRSAAQTLFESMRQRGFDPSSAVPVDQWGRLRDGAHRIACAAVLGLDVTLLHLSALFPIRQWGIDWFLAHGFSKAYVNGLLDDVNLLTGYCGSAAVPSVAMPLKTVSL